PAWAYWPSRIRTERLRPVPQRHVTAWVVLAVLGFLGDDALVVPEDLHVVGPGQPQRIGLRRVEVGRVAPAVGRRQRVEPMRLVNGGLIDVRVVVEVDPVALVVDRREVPCGGKDLLGGACRW